MSYRRMLSLPSLLRRRAHLSISNWTNLVADILAGLGPRGGGPHPALAMAHTKLTGVPCSWSSSEDPLASSFGAILWNTPKFRRSLEQRHKKMFGKMEWGTLKIMTPKRRLRNDHKTGEDFELGKLAPEWYRRAMEETREIQERMGRAFGMGPKDREVAVIYKGDENRFGEGDRSRMQLVEMEKERPPFFSPSLMQKANKTPAAKARDESSTTVRPTGLG